MITVGKKDKEYMAVMADVLEEAYEYGFDLGYFHTRAAVILCMLDRMRGRKPRELNSDYYYQDEVETIVRDAMKEKYAREHCID